MNNCSTNSYTRNRRCTKQPIYTSDKRAKFTQRENKKWIRFLTVLGYIFFVSLPALSLSFYYIYMWDPGYMSKLPHNDSAAYPAKYFDTIKTDRIHRAAEQVDSTMSSTVSPTTDQSLENILRDGAKSMESSHSKEIGS